MRAPFPKGLKGDRAQGRQFYLANCATCHGPKGDGQGPRAYFQNPKPRNFLEPAGKRTYNRPFLFAAVSMGKLGTEIRLLSQYKEHDHPEGEICDACLLAWIKSLKFTAAIFWRG